jgi:hypothetical protein
LINDDSGLSELIFRISARTAFPSRLAAGSIYFDRETNNNTAKHLKMKRQRMMQLPLK